MKVAIFENEKELFENTFKAVNLIYFSGAAEFDWFVSSQEIGDNQKLTTYDAIIVDLDLSRKSVMDGYSLIESALQLGVSPKKIILFTGSDRVKLNLKEKGYPDFPVIAKPPMLSDISDKIKHATQ